MQDPLTTIICLELFLSCNYKAHELRFDLISQGWTSRKEVFTKTGRGKLNPTNTNELPCWLAKKRAWKPVEEGWGKGMGLINSDLHFLIDSLEEERLLDRPRLNQICLSCRIPLARPRTFISRCNLNTRTISLIQKLAIGKQEEINLV